MARPALRSDPQVIPLPIEPAYPVTREMIEDDERLPPLAGLVIGMVCGAAIWTAGIWGAWVICRLIW